jgi:hypothetical protein
VQQKAKRIDCASGNGVEPNEQSGRGNKRIQLFRLALDSHIPPSSRDSMVRGRKQEAQAPKVLGTVFFYSVGSFFDVG